MLLLLPRQMIIAATTHRVESLAGKLGSDVFWGIRASKSTLIF